MTQAFRAPSPLNMFPVANNYVISFARKKSQFPLNRYSQLVQADAMTFFYKELDRDQPVRVRNLALHQWAPRAKREPRGDNQFTFRNIQATCLRYDFNDVLDNETIAAHESEWKIKQWYLTGLTSQAMTARTLNVWKGITADAAGSAGWTGLDNPATWPTGSIADVNTLNNNAGTWDRASAQEGDSAFMAIKKSLTAAANSIFLNTNGRVEWKDLRLIVNPDLARAMGNSGEIREYYKYGPFAKQAIEDPAVGSTNYNDEYGLPSHLYGIEVVVESSMYLNDLPTAGATGFSTNRAFIKSPHNAVIVSRPGGIDADAGPAFSTFQLYYVGSQLQYEEFSEPRDRYTELHVSDTYTPVGTALVSGYMIQNVF